MQSSRPSSIDLTYNENDLMYYDSYFGSDQFIGEEAIWVDKKAYWSMNYAGRKIDENFSFDFLKKALLMVNAETPFRGPSEYSNSAYTYKCLNKGDFQWFQGIETIEYENKIIYECYFHGGTIR